ncbi:MAG: protein-glutamate O-methyltransferase CheR [Rhodocyclaceae bacterium]
MDDATLSDREFASFQKLIHGITGIHLAPAKKALLCGRLAKRLRSRNLRSYSAYFDLVSSGKDPSELETCVNLLTTNETYFFREAKHFDLLRNSILPARKLGSTFRAWSAACSSGEEVYTLAMILADVLGINGPWEILGSDISTDVLERAARGHYPMERAQNIPPEMLKKFCLRGVGDQSGTLLVDPALRKRVRFAQINLNNALPQIGDFDVIFLRNVMIYFQLDVKKEVVARIVQRLHPGGHLFIGHSESLNGVNDSLQALIPAAYQKPSR